MEFSRYWLYMNTNIQRDFHICISVLLIENFIFCAVRIWGAVLEKLLSTKFFFAQHHLVFADMKHLFVLHQLFFCWHETIFCYFCRHQITFGATSNTQNCFPCNTKFLFWTLFRILCHLDMLLLSRSNKNITTCQKNKEKR